MNTDEKLIKKLEDIKNKLLNGEKVSGYHIAESGPFKGIVVKDKVEKKRHFI